MLSHRRCICKYVCMCIYLYTLNYLFVYVFVCYNSWRLRQMQAALELKQGCCIYIYIYLHVYMYTYIHIYIYTYIHIYIYTYIHIYTYTYTYTYTYAYTYTYTYTYTHTHTHTHTYIHTYIPTQGGDGRKSCLPLYRLRAAWSKADAVALRIFVNNTKQAKPRDLAGTVHWVSSHSPSAGR